MTSVYKRFVTKFFLPLKANEYNYEKALESIEIKQEADVSEQFSLFLLANLAGFSGPPFFPSFHNPSKSKYFSTSDERLHWSSA